MIQIKPLDNPTIQTGETNTYIGCNTKLPEFKCNLCGDSKMIMIGKTADPLSGWITNCPECEE